MPPLVQLCCGCSLRSRRFGFVLLKGEKTARERERERERVMERMVFAPLQRVTGSGGRANLLLCASRVALSAACSDGGKRHMSVRAEGPRTAQRHDKRLEGALKRTHMFQVDWHTKRTSPHNHVLVEQSASRAASNFVQIEPMLLQRQCRRMLSHMLSPPSNTCISHYVRAEPVYCASNRASGRLTQHVARSDPLGADFLSACFATEP